MKITRKLRKELYSDYKSGRGFAYLGEHYGLAGWQIDQIIAEEEAIEKPNDNKAYWGKDGRKGKRAS